MIGTYRLKRDNCYNICKEAVEKLNVRNIDTAQLYNNEDMVGKSVEGVRDSVYITSKIHVKNILGGQNTILNSIEDTIGKLGGYVDCLLLHCLTDNFLQAWSVLENEVNREKVREIGVSNFSTEAMEQLNGISCNQIEMSPFLPREDITLYCSKNNIKCTAHSPLAKGEKFNDPMVKKISLHYNKTPSQVMLQWCESNGAIPIFRSSDICHIESNLRYSFTMSEEHLKPWSEKKYMTHPKLYN